ncbi:hypothetical protein JB92DRAFT_1934433 [Gautieria morchelliformis]|nr:hypothetical protein JB92DRAFT_1934433 [Gautieria morchelliformis]
MFSVPAACIAAIFGCRSFVRVSTYSSSDGYVHSSGPADDRVSTHIGSPKNLRVQRHLPSDTFDSAGDLPYHTTTNTAINSATLGTGTTPSTNGVHVLMDTFSEPPNIRDDKECSPHDTIYAPSHPDHDWHDSKRGHSFVPDF